jgi:hypothetical protein
MKCNLWCQRPKNSAELKNAIESYHLKLKNDPNEQYLIQRAIEAVPNRLRTLIMFDGQNVDSKKRRQAAFRKYIETTWHRVPSDLISKNTQFVPTVPENLEVITQ